MKALNYKYGLFLGLIILLFTSCDLEKEVNITLPEYESQKILECYLEPGKPFQLLLSKSAGYFDPIPSDDLIEFLEKTLESDADVRIRYNDREIILKNEIKTDLNFQKFYNYHSDEIVPVDYNATFELEIILADGHTITSSTRILPPVPIDSIAIEYDENNLARTLIFIKDDKSIQRYYRRTLHYASLDSIPQQDFLSDNSIIDNGMIVFGSGFDSAPGATVINTIFHLDKDYFDFLVSMQGAIASNGNPFVQPGVIFSNLKGSANAIGIFTGLSYDRKFTIIP